LPEEQFNAMMTALLLPTNKARMNGPLAQTTLRDC
jgi:hypothetical protein